MEANRECQNLDDFYLKSDRPEVHPDSAPYLGNLRLHSSLTHLIKWVVLTITDRHSKIPSYLEATRRFKPWWYYFYLP